MRIYSVGGFVRDMLLRREGFDIPENGDRDWVVVGATPELMLEKGFKPVGADFPVFLHPATHEEYALARTERKTAPGYHGFVFHTAPTVTLEEDLRRRDLTINAIAMDENGELTDPYDGRGDIQRRLLRHVSEAFEEDPVRILRVARFAARFPSFDIAQETMALMRRMVDSGETDALVAERVWAEWSRAMAAVAPVRFLDTLVECGLWDRLLSDLPKPDDTMRETLLRAVKSSLTAESRIALLFTRCASQKAVAALCEAFRMPAKTAQLCTAFHATAPLFSASFAATEVAKLLERADALRRPERMRIMIRMAEIRDNRAYPALYRALEAWCSLDAGSVAKTVANPRDIPAAVRAARVATLNNIDFGEH